MSEASVSTICKLVDAGCSDKEGEGTNCVSATSSLSSKDKNITL